MKKPIFFRILMSVIGVTLSGVSVGIFRTAALGVDPFQSFMSGINSVVPIHFGTLYIIVNALLLLFSLIFDRSKIGIATLINLTLLGYVVEWSERIVSGFFPNPGTVTRVLLLLVAIVILCFASAMYFNANLGVSTYDAISLVVYEKQSKRTDRMVPFKVCRIISDLLCVMAGTTLLKLSGLSWHEVAAFVGPATIITALFMGPLISAFRKILPDYTVSHSAG